MLLVPVPCALARSSANLGFLRLLDPRHLGQLLLLQRLPPLLSSLCLLRFLLLLLLLLLQFGVLLCLFPPGLLLEAPPADGWQLLVVCGGFLGLVLL